ARGAVIDAGVRIESGAYIGGGAIIGANTIVGPNAFIDNATIGTDCVIYNNASIGKDGFGYTRQDGKNIFMPHAGRVVLGDRVAVGAMSCIDRGLLTDTKIGDGTKIDNLVQVAHGVVIGCECFLAALTGLAGGVVIGDRAVLGGNVGLANGVHIGEDAEIAAKSGLFRNVPAGEKVLGYPATNAMEYMRMHAWLRAQVKK
ncbi:MAG: UDP-3-O-(3-hydroxymyristoyl)glucosamine N-acyltransferase, partial [Alphaproteobacteria bacterium]|nr:UDP-3-O-(3-hydroxymyristoyl)glucosamine N-acyltransferase [Alphaproteobacteria bacterium]